MEEIMNIIIQVLAMLLALCASWLCKYMVNWMKSKLDEEGAEKLDLFVSELVAAAEQLYKDDDFDGSIRLDYVQKMLIEAGYEINDVVRAVIESKVFEINLMNSEK